MKPDKRIAAQAATDQVVQELQTVLARLEQERFFAMLSAQGTACVETTLVEAEYADPECVRNAESRARQTKGPDAPVPGTWTDVTDNEAVRDYITGHPGDSE